jgi:triacylglycerol lipase
MNHPFPKRIQMILAQLLLLLPSSRLSASSTDDCARSNKGDYVVLLHGLGRTCLSMKRLEWTLKKERYQVVNLTYPSTRLSLQELATNWLPQMLSEQTPEASAKIHFVTHSLGGIILREYLQDHKIPNPGRVVMLAPPNHGSEVADKLQHNIFYKFFTGPAGQELGTKASRTLTWEGAAQFELGIIAGDRSLNPWLSAYIGGPNDGKVSVQSAKLEGMQDFLVVHHSHTWMMWRQDVTAAISGFLNSGRFPGKAAPFS